MTVQYEQPLINLGGVPATAVDNVDATLTTDDSLVVVNTATATSTITLANAASMPGRAVMIVAETGATNGVTIAAGAGDTILGTIAANPIVSDGGSVTLVSNGGTQWIVQSDQA